MNKGLYLLGVALSLAIPSSAWGQESPVTVLPEAPRPLFTAAVSSVPQPLFSSSASGEDPDRQTSAAGSTPQTTSEDQVREEKKQRLLGIMPAFNTVPGGQAAPLRPGQKFDLWFHSAIDPFTIGVAAIDGGIEQAENTYPEYRQGVEGYAKRFGAAYADNVDGNFWGNAVLPALLHQDPRYFRLGQGSFKRRLGYAALSTVRCKGDNGRWQPSYSNIGGNLIGGAISNVYYPASERGVGLTLERGFTVTAEGVIGALAFEFYPDLVQHYKARHQRSQTP